MADIPQHLHEAMKNNVTTFFRKTEARRFGIDTG